MDNTNKLAKKNKFTIHFATINTMIFCNSSFPYSEFTIHFATINTLNHNNLSSGIKDLQYTLLLLIHTFPPTIVSK